MVTGVQPLVETGFRETKIDIGDADLLEAELFAPDPDISGELCKILRR
jgi:hypothetical protein